MIRRTLRATQEATFSVDLPGEPTVLTDGVVIPGRPVPHGTGFFISPEGWFVTAAHVITQNGRSDGPVRADIGQAWLIKPASFTPDFHPSAMCQYVELDYVDVESDFALLKVDFQRNASRDWLRDRDHFPFIEVSTRVLDEGEPVYSFGYPLPEPFEILLQPGDVARFSLDESVELQVGPFGGAARLGGAAYSPRTTSAIVASAFEQSGGVMSSRDPQVYVLDKALNYGNSGGPIVAVETGKVHAICSRFQPLLVRQSQMEKVLGADAFIFMPSLYSIVPRLSDPQVLSVFESRNIPISDE